MKQGLGGNTIPVVSYVPPSLLTETLAAPNGQILTGYDDGGDIRRPGYSYPVADWGAWILHGQSLSLASTLNALAYSSIRFTATNPVWNCIMALGGLNAAFTGAQNTALEPYPNATPGNWNGWGPMYDIPADYAWVDPTTYATQLLLVGPTILAAACYACVAYAVARGTNPSDPGQVMFGIIPGRGGEQNANLLPPSPQSTKLVNAIYQAATFATAAGKSYQLRRATYFGGQANTQNPPGTDYWTEWQNMMQWHNWIYQLALAVNLPFTQRTGLFSPPAICVIQNALNGTVSPWLGCAAFDACEQHPLGDPIIASWDAPTVNGPHLSPTGYVMLGDREGYAADQRLNQNRRPDTCQMLGNPVYELGTIKIPLEVPGPPTRSLAQLMSIPGLPATPQDGVFCYDVNGYNVLSNGRLIGNGAVLQYDAARAPGVGAMVRICGDARSTGMTSTQYTPNGASCDWFFNTGTNGKNLGTPLYIPMATQQRALTS